MSDENGVKMNIEIDGDVYGALKELAEPFVDTPNDVLRRILLNPGPSPAPFAGKKQIKPNIAASLSTSENFVNKILAEHFKGQIFKRVPPYRFFFESDDSVVYFQNFNQPSDRLWYRLKEKPWNELTHSEKKAVVCFTNPAMGFAYIMPVSDIDLQVGALDWERDDLEVNIDVSRSHWLELDWLIDDYRRHFPTQ